MHPNDTPEPTKQCTKCREIKPTYQFDRHKRHKDGRSTICRQCRAEREGREYHPTARPGYKWCSRCRQELPATIEYFGADKRYNIFGSRCKACAREAAKEWQTKNPGRVVAKALKWAKNNPQRFRNNQRKYAARHPQLMRVHDLRRRTRKANATGEHTAIDIDSQYKAQKGKCYYCHAKVGNRYHIDHVIPLSRGGSNGPENLVIACPHCNASKHNKMPHEWPQGNRLL